MPEAVKSDPDEWPGDALSRKKYATYLTALLVTRTFDNAKKRAIGNQTIALDAAWGIGKTFFVERWSNDLREAGYPVVLFDAWRNDQSVDPGIFFMAHVLDALKIYSDQLPSTKAVGKTVTSRIVSLRRSLRKAVVPAAGAIAKGLLKKYVGDGVDELGKILAGDGATVQTEPSGDSENAVRSSIDEGLDAAFDEALSEKKARDLARAEFRVELEKLVVDLAAAGVANGPLFVFVDELDRCRPTYAISLLEEIKHLFGVPGTCFVVSTNQKQLSASIKAVYGSSFDAHGYLKRFFDVEYRLPDPDYAAYSSVLVDEFPSPKQHKIVPVLPLTLYRSGSKANDRERLSTEFALVAKAFDLDLRSQRQVYSVAMMAIAGSERISRIYGLMLFTLAAFRHKRPDLFARCLARPEYLADPGWTSTPDIVGIENQTIPYPKDFGIGWGDNRFENSNFFELVRVLADAATTEASALGAKGFTQNSQKPYPHTLYQLFAEEFNNMPRMTNQLYFSQAKMYPSAIALAGHILNI